MKRTALIGTLMFVTLTLVAQNFQYPGQPQFQPQQQRQQFSPEGFKNGMEQFIRHYAELTPSEAQKFFPMLTEMQDKQRVISGKKHELMKQGFTAKTEVDYEKVITKINALEIENAKVEQTYYKKFHSVLTWKKIYKVRQALFRFNMEALRTFSPPRDKQGDKKGDKK